MILTFINPDISSASWIKNVSATRHNYTLLGKYLARPSTKLNGVAVPRRKGGSSPRKVTGDEHY
jgi:hypothetical protein